MMSHAQHEERLAVYPDLAPAERTEVDAHLATCAACAALLGDYRRLHQALRSRPAPRPSPRLRQGFAAAVAQPQARGAGLWAELSRAALALGNAAVWTAVAAVALLLVVGVIVAGRPLVERAWPAGQPTGTAGDRWVTGHLSVEGQVSYACRLLIPADWAGKYEVTERGNTVSFAYTVPPDVRELLAGLTPAPGLARPNPSETLFWVSLFSDARWREEQQQPGVGRVVRSLDGLVVVSGSAIANMYSAFSSEPWPRVAAEFQRMAGQVPGILQTLEVAGDPTRSTPTPLAEPAVAVTRLERLQDLCCPPRFAPDGKTYLTVRDGRLYERALGGGPETERPIDVRQGDAPLQVSNAAWTPDGARIVVTVGAPQRGNTAALYLVDPASGAARALGETSTPWRLTFDTRGRIVVGTQTGYQALQLDSGAAVAIPGIAPRDASGVETELAFSPDGRSLAALQGQELAIVDLASGLRTSVTVRIHPQWRACFAWSTDGRQLAYATGVRGAAPELWVVNADGSGARRLVTRAGDRSGAYAGLSWLPGTPYIVYEYVPDSNTATLQGEYQVVSAAGGPAKTLFTNGLGLTLSPDGHVISFVRDLPGPDETGSWVAVLEYGEVGEAATPAPTPAPSATAQPVRVPPGTVALYGVGAPQENVALYALSAGGTATALGVEVPWGTVASGDGRWLAHADAPMPGAHAVVVENLQDRRRYTIPLSDACVAGPCVTGLYAFDHAATRLASVEVTRDAWAIVVANLQDGSSRRFEMRRPQASSYPIMPGAPLGWASTGELLLDTFAPFSEGAFMGVWALTLPDSGAPAAIDALPSRQLLAPRAYRQRPQLSPDGARLLYLARDPGYTPAGYPLSGGFEDMAVNQLWSLSLVSGAATKLVDINDGGALAPAAAWSLDGREALFAQGRYASSGVLGRLTLEAVVMAGALREIGPLEIHGTLSALYCGWPGLALATTYGQASELYTVDLATGRATLAARDAVVLATNPLAEGEEAGIPAEGPPVTTSAVDGWIGTVVALDPLAQYDDYFLRNDGERYGIDGSAAGLTAQIESARRQGNAIQVWGQLQTNVPDAYGRQIIVERLDVISVPAAVATPCPSRSIDLPAPARFDPLPDARGAIAVSTAGGGFGLAFPDTGAVVPVHTLVPWCGQQVREADRGLAWSPDG
ncbi:MAG TPA: hypothetical protein PLG21_13470, partial [Anaerolineae bacterium]|nr:hypothetical protein [Anaerolineae bacterium]